MIGFKFLWIKVVIWPVVNCRIQNYILLITQNNLLKLRMSIHISMFLSYYFIFLNQHLIFFWTNFIVIGYIFYYMTIRKQMLTVDVIGWRKQMLVCDLKHLITLIISVLNLLLLSLNCCFQLRKPHSYLKD